MRGKAAFHPPDFEWQAEAYCLGTLALSEATAFEDHYFTCAQCAQALEQISQYVAAMREAARTLRTYDRGSTRAGAAADR